MRADIAVSKAFGVHYFVENYSKSFNRPPINCAASKIVKIRPSIARMNNIPSSCFFIVLIVCATLFFQSQNALYN
jgi:hypothetical protein